jgi:hypothetical protein
MAVRWTVFGGIRSVRVLAPKADIEWIWWAAGAAAVVLLGLLMLALNRKQPQPVPSAPAQPPPQVVVQPVPLPAPAPAPPDPNRGKTLSEPRQAPAPAVAQPPATRKKTEVRVEFSAPVPGRPAAWLVSERGPHAGRRFGVDNEHYWIGAGDGNQLVLEDDTVSWSHACILFEHADLYLFDDSRNGTLVNGEKVNKERRRLNGGDTIQIGQSLFRLERR